MAKTANLYARIEPDVKERAEEILTALGIPVSNAINMFYKQIILQRGIPFEMKLPQPKMMKSWKKDTLMFWLAGQNRRARFLSRSERTMAYDDIFC